MVEVPRRCQRRRGIENGEGVSTSPADYRVWGSVMSSPSGAPAENGWISNVRKLLRAMIFANKAPKSKHFICQRL